MGPSTAYDIIVNVLDTTHEVGPQSRLILPVVSGP